MEALSKTIIITETWSKNLKVQSHESYKIYKNRSHFQAVNLICINLCVNHRKTAHERKQSNSFSVHSLSIVLKWLCLIEVHILRKFNRQFHLLVQSSGHYRQIMFILLPHLNAASLFHSADPAHFTPCKVFIQRTSLFTHTHTHTKNLWVTLQQVLKCPLKNFTP